MASGQVGWLCGPDQVLLLPYAGLPAVSAMWAIMMLAMMLPTLVPMLATYQNLPCGVRADGAGWVGLVVGYAAIWSTGAALFALTQWSAISAGLLDVRGIAASPWLTALLLALAGGWQFTRGKEICQDACLSPMHYFTGRFRPGFSGGVIMGTEIGATCVGCCWAIMALAFVGGMASLIFMGVATAFMVAEKLPELGQPIRKPAGVILILAALFVGLSGWPYGAAQAV